MSFDQDLAVFMVSPVMIILGTCDDAHSPDIGRAVGAMADAAKGRIDLVVSQWQWPKTVANIRETGRLSATFARPSDYASYQAKGRASVVPATPEHLRHSARYVEAMTATLEGLGLDRWTVAPWFVTRDPVALAFSVEAVFVQTPGAQAGQLLEPQR
jgi:hypothetical protein